MPDQDISTMLGAASPYSPTAGPFSNVLQSGLVPGLAPQNNERPSGFMGTTGKLAFFGTKLLEGIQRGRALSYMKQETAKENEFKSQMINLGVMMQNPELTPKQRYDLQKIQGQLFQMHLGNALDQTDQQQGGGDKDKTKGKKKKDSDQPEHPADQIKGVLRNILTGLSGGKMPETKDTTAWLNSQLAAIGNPPGLHSQMDDNLRTIKGAVSVLQQEYAKAHPESPEMPLEALRNGLQENKDATTAISNLTRLQGGDPAKAWNYIGTALQLPKPKEQQLKEESQQVGISEQKENLHHLQTVNKEEDLAVQDQEEYARIARGESVAPPEARSAATGAPPIDSSITGPPKMKRIAPVELTPQQQTAMSYATSDSKDMFREAIPPKSTKTTGNTVFVTAPNGGQMTLWKPAPGVLLQPGTYRRFDLKLAEQQGGWRFDDKQPSRPPTETPRAWFDSKSGKTYDVERDPATGKYRLTEGPDGKPMEVKEKGVVSEVKSDYVRLDGLLKTKTGKDQQIRTAYNLKSAGLKADPSLAPAQAKIDLANQRAKLDKDRDDELQYNAQAFKDNSQLILQRLRAFGVAYSLDNMGGEESQPTSNAPVTGIWGDYIK